MMTGPWYEESYPDSNYVRDHEWIKYTNDDKWIRENQEAIGYVWKLFDITNDEQKKSINEYLETSLKEVITDDNKNEWGSFRGYATFGISNKLVDTIRVNCLLKIKDSIASK